MRFIIVFLFCFAGFAALFGWITGGMMWEEDMLALNAIVSTIFGGAIAIMDGVTDADYRSRMEMSRRLDEFTKSGRLP